jgi:myo-inositol-1(or 4)-monophosphatase
MALFSPALNVMMGAASKAARSLRRDFGEVENLQVSTKGPGDFVSQADIRAEKTIFEELSRARPGYGFLMEERGTVEGPDKSHRWIIDPLDGTTNFLHSIPIFAISIALEREGVLVAGVIYNPITDEMFVAERGTGAFLNNRRLRVSARSRMAEAVFTTGIPHQGRSEPNKFMRDMDTLLPQVAGIRRFGSAALDLAFVAAGRVDGYWERGLKAWDIAAGAVIVQEAGGMVSDIDGSDGYLNSGNIVAGNPSLFNDLQKQISR